MVKISFETDNAAFHDELGYSKRYEIMRILKNITRRIDNGDTEGKVMDVNGNSIGQWSID